jgi:hypothetical protein
MSGCSRVLRCCCPDEPAAGGGSTSAAVDDSESPTLGEDAVAVGDDEVPFRLLELPEHLLVRVLANLGHGSLARAARSCPALACRELVDDAARLAIVRAGFGKELLACAPRTGSRRWMHIFGELEALVQPLMFGAHRAEALELDSRGQLLRCWLGPSTALASTGVPLRAGVHSAELTIDPERLSEGRPFSLDFGLAAASQFWDPDKQFRPAQRYGVRLSTFGAVAFTHRDPLRQNKFFSPALLPGDRVRLRCDMDRGEIGIYVNDTWCGLAHRAEELRSGCYEFFVTFDCVTSVSIR